MLAPYDDAMRNAYLMLWAMPKYARTLAQEWAALPLSAAQVGDGCELREILLAVLTPETVPEERMQAENALAGASVLGRHVIVQGAGHDFPFRRPDAVIQAIAEVVAQVRAQDTP